MATPNGGDSDLPNKVCDITNCVTIYYEKDVRAGMPSFGKKVLSLDVKEIEDAQSFEINCEERFTSHLLNMGMKIFFFWYVNKRKENSKLTFYRKKVTIIGAYFYLPPIESLIFYAISIFLKFLVNCVLEERENAS